ncbi:MAG: hypothetical protein M3416_05955 [Acidobacteriota bacterium]|nr:hypothetical protein [Acidobacteriota bacterium]
MNTASYLALRELADSLPPCDALNLGYALLVEGELPDGAMARAVHEILRADPSLNGQSPWREGRVERERLAALAAAHLSTPLGPTRPFNAALWSCGETTHLFLLAAHHSVADGVVLDRIAADLSRSLQGEPIEPVSSAEPRCLPAPAEFASAGLPLPAAAPSMRASCRAARLPDRLAQDFRDLARSWRTTPFAAAVACVSAVTAAWAGVSEVGVSVQIAGRNSNEAQRAPGPWYDHSDLRVTVPAGEPLRSLLSEVTHQILKGLSSSGVWAANRQTGPYPELLVVYDRHPLSGLKIPGCRVRPLAVRRHPRRVDGAEEYLVATDADVVVFFREQSGTIGLSLFTKTARVPEPTAEWLFAAIVDALRALCEQGEHPLDPADPPPLERVEAAPPAAWPEPALCDLPLTDAVSPVFRVRPETLAAFGRDARSTLDAWGSPPWR